MSMRVRRYSSGQRVSPVAWLPAPGEILSLKLSGPRENLLYHYQAGIPAHVSTSRQRDLAGDLTTGRSSHNDAK